MALTRINNKMIKNSLNEYSNDLATAVATIGSTPTRLVVNTVPEALTGNVVVPSNISLDWLPGCIASGAYTLTINGSLDAGNYQIFGDDITINNLTVAHPEWFGAVGDSIVDDTIALQSAISALSDGGIININSAYLISSDIDLPRIIRLVGKTTETSRIVSNTNNVINITGSVSFTVTKDTRTLNSSVIEKIYFFNVGIVYGETSSDFGQGSILRDCNIVGPDIGIQYTNNSWNTLIDSTFIRNCSTGVLFDYKNGVNSGARQIVSNSVISNNTNGIKISGSTQSGDGADIHLSNIDFERNDYSILVEDDATYPASGVIINAQNMHFELDNISHISNDGSSIFINNIWSFGNSAAVGSTWVAHFECSDGVIDISSGRIGYSSSGGKLVKITNTGKILLNQENCVITTTYGNQSAVYNTSSTLGLSYPTGSTFNIDDSDVAVTNTPATILTYGAYHRYRIRSEFIFKVSAVSTTNQITLLNQTGGTTLFSVTLPNELGVGKISIVSWYTGTNMRHDIYYTYTGTTTTQSGYDEKFIAMAKSDNKYLDVKTAGDSTMTLRHVISTIIE